MCVVAPLFLLKTPLQKAPLPDWLLCCFGFRIWKGSVVFVFSRFPTSYPVRKQLTVFSQSAFNLPVMRWKTWRAYFSLLPSKTLEAICQVNPLHPVCVCVCVCVHTFVHHVHAPTHYACHHSIVWGHPWWAPFLFTAPWVCLPLRVLCSPQHQWGTGDKNYYMRLHLLLTVADRPEVTLGNSTAQLYWERGMMWRH